MTQPVDLAAVLSQFDEPWLPRTVATLNDYDLRVVKAQGEFTRHSHQSCYVPVRLRRRLTTSE